MEAVALFDTGSRRSYICKELAEKIGYEPYDRPREVPLAVKGAFAKVVGRAAVFLEIDGYVLPEEETVGVIEDLAVDAIIGLNVMESYGIYIEGDEVKFKSLPPTSMIV